MTQTGFLLSYTRFGDHDAVLHCFTAEAGFQSFFLRGIYSAKNKKKAYLLPLNELNITLKPGVGRLLTATKLEPVSGPSGEQDLTSVNISFFLADFCQQILRDLQKQNDVYHELSEVSAQLRSGNRRAHLIFLMRMLKLSGYYPLLNAEDYLNAEAGVFEAHIYHPIFEKVISGYWKKLYDADFPYQLTIERADIRNLLDSIMIYYKLHFPNFSQPKSLDVLREIYQ